MKDGRMMYQLTIFIILQQHTEIKGIGSEIIEYCENLCRENSKKTLRLDCNINNNKLNDYYEKKRI